MDGKPVSLQAVAMRLLAGREHSREELRRKLMQVVQDEEEVERVLDRMTEAGFQSDARFAESFVRGRAARLGVGRLRHELAERGIDEETRQAALDGMQDGDELARARVVWAKKFGQAPHDRKEWARQARFLQARGFAVDVIRKLLKEPFDESA